MEPVCKPQNPVVKDHFPGSRTIARHHVDDAIRKARCFEYLHDYLRAVDLGVGRLPDNDAHQSGGSAQVGSDCRKVEGVIAKQNLPNPVFHPVPNAVLTIRLDILNFLEEIGVKAQEINQFAGRINFRLKMFLDCANMVAALILRGRVLQSNLPP